MNKFIYIATPYSTNADEELMWQRARDTAWYVGLLMNKHSDHFFYSPVVYFRQVALECDLPHTREFWWGVNKYMLDKADEIWVIKMDGWMHSEGVIQEIEYAYAIGKTARYIETRDIVLGKL